MIPIIQIVFGLIVLLGSADFLVRGAISIAQRFGVSTLMIGLTVVAFGTSTPEFVTTLAAAMRGMPGMAVGNIVGSNMANSLLIIGVAALACPFECSTRAVTRDGMVMLGATLLFVAIALFGGIERWHGAVLLATLFIYLGFSYRAESRRPEIENPLVQEVTEIKGVPSRTGVAVATVLAAMAGLVVGSRLLVAGGTEIAVIFHVSQEVIGLTMIAVGTSLPELATVVMASLRRHGDVAMGNIVGSNIFNLLAIGGGVSILEPLPVPAQILNFDLWAMLGVTCLMVLMLAKSRRVYRMQGAVLTGVYLFYVGAQYSPLRQVFDF